MQKHIKGSIFTPSLITGIYEVISDIYEDNSQIFVVPRRMANENFPLRIKLKPITIFKNPIQFKPLIPKLSFIKNKVMWSGSIRSAMRVIPETDYELIINAESQ